jgi:hypothetical protein
MLSFFFFCFFNWECMRLHCLHTNFYMEQLHHTMLVIHYAKV